MRNFSVSIRERDVSTDAAYRYDESLTFVVDHYSHSIEGGPKDAVITVFGTEGALWSIFDTLRCPIIIYNDSGQAVWWGFISDTEVRASWVVARASLEGMYNSVGVAYSDMGARDTLKFLTDSYSIDTYGEKQYRLSMSEASEEQAAARRETALEFRKFPAADISFAAQGEGGLSATITARGWIDTLDWKYYAQEKGLVQHSEGGSGRLKIGFVHTSTSVMFSGSTITSGTCSIEIFDEGDIIAVYGSASGNNGTYQVEEVSSTDWPHPIVDVQAASVAAGPYTSASMDSGGSGASRAGFFWVFDIDRTNGDEELAASVQTSNNLIDWNTEYEFNGASAAGRDSDTGASAGRYRRAIYKFSGTGPFSASFLVGSGSHEGKDVTVTETFPSRESAGSTIQITTGSKAAQTFAQFSGSAWDASRVYVRVQPTGSPSDYFIVRIRDGNSALSSSPGVTLASGSIAASDMDEDLSWQSVPLSACVTLTTGSHSNYYAAFYWVQVERSASRGDISGSDHYIIDVDEDLGYQDGYLKVYAGYQYNERVPDADMLFRVTGTQKTNRQIKEIVEATGDFIRDVDMQMDTGVETNQWRSGDNTALYEITQLVETGTASGTRIILNVNKERTLSIKKEPENCASGNYTIGTDRKLHSPGGADVDLSECFFGGWLSLADVIPPNVAHLVTGMTDFFVEEAEYYPESDTYVPRSRGVRDPWNISNIGEG